MDPSAGSSKYQIRVLQPEAEVFAELLRLEQGGMLVGQEKQIEAGTFLLHVRNPDKLAVPNGITGGLRLGIHLDGRALGDLEGKGIEILAVDLLGEGKAGNPFVPEGIRFTSVGEGLEIEATDHPPLHEEPGFEIGHPSLARAGRST